MGEVSVRRLFIAQYETMKGWMGGTTNILRTIKKDDLFLVFKAGIESPDLNTRTLDVFDKMGESKILIDSCIPGTEEFQSQVLSEIARYAHPDLEVYFLALDADYAALKDKIEGCKGVGLNKTYRVQNSSLYIKNKKNGSTEKKNKKPKKRSTERQIQPTHSSTSFDDDIFHAMTAMPSVPVSASENQKEIRVEKPAMAEKPVPDPGIPDIPVPPAGIDIKMPDISVSPAIDIGNPDIAVHKNDAPVSSDIKIKAFPEEANKPNEPVQKTVQKKPAQPLKRPSRQVGGGQTGGGQAGGGKPQGRPQGRPNRPQGRPAAQAPSLEENYTQEELEIMIFENGGVPTVMEDTMSEYAQARANVSNKLFDRLVSNIERLVRGISDYGFSQDQYMKLVMTMIKSENFKDFVDGWEISEPKYPLAVTEEIYDALKDEALYYSRVCDVLYGEDHWAYLAKPAPA